MSKASLPPQIDVVVWDNGHHAIRFNIHISYRLITDTIDKIRENSWQMEPFNSHIKKYASITVFQLLLLQWVK